MTDEELIALADRLENLSYSVLVSCDDDVDLKQAAAVIRKLVAERGK